IAETPTQSCSPCTGGVSAQAGWVQQSPGQLWVLPGDTAKFSCHISEYRSYVDWYKEKLDGSLERIYRSAHLSSPRGKYSGRNITGKNFFLAISPAQREDSGVYYCSYFNIPLEFGSGTRLVVSSATEPQLFILVPIGAEEPGQPPATFPLLCHLHDIPAGWDTVRWQPGGDVTPMMAAAVDEHGVLSAWSITWVSAEHW
ncbi:KV6A9 protein, partial [Atlantisia rogersi]|nr:KV6A9 protein [Atlantisia rogersi]